MAQIPHLAAGATTSSRVPALVMKVLGRPVGSWWRYPMAAAALTGVAAHVPVIRPHLVEAPYMGALFIVLTLACVAIAAAAVVADGLVVYGLAVLTCALAVVGYAATRLVAFPQLGDDVGNWLEPLGVVSVAAETVVILTSVRALRAAR